MERLDMKSTNRVLLGHVAVALSRYVKELRREGVTAPSEVLALAEFVADCVTPRQDASRLGAGGDQPDSEDMKVYPMLTKREAAAALRCSVSTVERLIRAGSLTAVKVEGSTRIRRVDFDFYIAGLTHNSFRHAVEEKAG